jgi:uncharacterized protein (DUF924 family)
VTQGNISPADVIAFWREAGPKKWFAKDDDFDRAITERFGRIHKAAAAGECDSWAETAEGALALVVLLDQFSRNLYRGRPGTYMQDERARRIARQAIERGFDKGAEPELRQFFCLPFMHSESIADQNMCVALAHAYGRPENFKYARHHRAIVRRFGRFPHRNTILGRHTTPAEAVFLAGGGFAG